MRSALAATFLRLCMVVTIISAGSLSANAQNCEPLTGPQLKQLLLNMGLTPKQINEAGKPDKYEISNEYGGLNIPVAVEITSSTNYIWLTVNLGKVPADSSSRSTQLLRQNFAVQPCQFYITTKSVLMMGIALENRGMTSSVMRRSLDLILKRVSETQSYWQ